VALTRDFARALMLATRVRQGGGGAAREPGQQILQTRD